MKGQIIGQGPSKRFNLTSQILSGEFKISSASNITIQVKIRWTRSWSSTWNLIFHDNKSYDIFLHLKNLFPFPQRAKYEFSVKRHTTSLPGLIFCPIGALLSTATTAWIVTSFLDIYSSVLEHWSVIPKQKQGKQSSDVSALALKEPLAQIPWGLLTMTTASWPGWPQPADPAKQEPIKNAKKLANRWLLW